MIKCATKEDISSLELIENSVFTKFDYPLNRRNFLYHIKKRQIFIIVEQNKICGYMLFFEYKKSIRLYSIAISLDYISLGYGTKLMKYLINFANSKSKYLTLEVKVDNVKAINIYRKFGFRDIKYLKSYYRDGKNGIKMKLNPN